MEELIKKYTHRQRNLREEAAMMQKQAERMLQMAATYEDVIHDLKASAHESINKAGQDGGQIGRLRDTDCDMVAKRPE